MTLPLMLLIAPLTGDSTSLWWLWVLLAVAAVAVAVLVFLKWRQGKAGGPAAPAQKPAGDKAPPQETTSLAEESKNGTEKDASETGAPAGEEPKE